jgi:hypothetical protein
MPVVLEEATMEEELACVVAFELLLLLVFVELPPAPVVLVIVLLAGTNGGLSQARTASVDAATQDPVSHMMHLLSDKILRAVTIGQCRGRA